MGADTISRNVWLIGMPISLIVFMFFFGVFGMAKRLEIKRWDEWMVVGVVGALIGSLWPLALGGAATVGIIWGLTRGPVLLGEGLRSWWQKRAREAKESRERAEKEREEAERGWPNADTYAEAEANRGTYRTLERCPTCGNSLKDSKVNASKERVMPQ